MADGYPSAEQTFADADARIEEAKKILARAVPLAEGGPGWRYLVEHRRLPAAAVRAAASELRDLEPIVPGRLAHEYGLVSVLCDPAGSISGL